MADNITLNAGAGGSVCATDEDGSGYHHQWVKVKHGASNTFTETTQSTPFPTSSADRTDAISNDGTEVNPAFVAISAASTDNTLLAAQGAGNKIRVVSMVLVSAGIVDARFENGTGGSALTGVMSLTTNSGFVLPYNPVGWFETSANTLLNLELSGTVQVSGCMTYIVVT